MELSLNDLHRLPQDSFYVTLQGKLVSDWSSLKECDHFLVHLRVLGGKGGFGSLLRSFGSQFYKSTNQDMCRDLSGRRLKDVKEEERLKKYIEKAAEREKEKQRKLEEKYKKLKQLEDRKHEFNDLDYNQQRERILEETEEALREGLKASQSSVTPILPSSEAGPSGVSPKLTSKRKHDEEGASSSSASSEGKSSSSIPKVKKAKMTIAGGLWLGIDGINEELDSSDGETEDKSEDGEDTEIRKQDEKKVAASV